MATTQNTQTSQPRKLVITKAFKRKWAILASMRYISSRRKDPNKSLTYCRDTYWKQYPHSYRHVGKLLYHWTSLNSKFVSPTYDGYASFLNSLTEAELQTALTEIQQQVAAPAASAAVVPAPPQPAPSDPQHGTNLDSLSGSGTPTGPVGFQTTQIAEDEMVPNGFSNKVHLWSTHRSRAVNTDNQHQLQAKLRQALMSISQCRVLRGVEDGDLDMDRLTDIGGGINLTGLFHRRIPGRRLSVATQIYADISYSMQTDAKDMDGIPLPGVRHSHLQLKLCVTLGYVLERLRIPTQIIAYDDQCYMVKQWHQPVLKSTVVKMPLTEGGTNMPLAMANGFRELSKRKEERLVACVISDGDIGCEVNAAETTLVDTSSGTPKTWQGKPPASLALRKSYPKIETCFFGIGPMNIPDCAFDYKLTGLSANIVEQVSNRVVQVIVGR